MLINKMHNSFSESIEVTPDRSLCTSRPLLRKLALLHPKLNIRINKGLFWPVGDLLRSRRRSALRMRKNEGACPVISSSVLVLNAVRLLLVLRSGLPRRLRRDELRDE